MVVNAPKSTAEGMVCFVALVVPISGNGLILTLGQLPDGSWGGVLSMILQ